MVGIDVRGSPRYELPVPEIAQVPGVQLIFCTLDSDVSTARNHQRHAKSSSPCSIPSLQYMTSTEMYALLVKGPEQLQELAFVTQPRSLLSKPSRIFQDSTHFFSYQLSDLTSLPSL